jgi:hypothetical protein
MYLLVYVDDVIVTSSCPSAVEALLKDLNSDFVLKDLGTLEYFLGVQVMKQGDGIVLCQEKLRLIYLTKLA